MPARAATYRQLTRGSATMAEGSLTAGLDPKLHTGRLSSCKQKEAQYQEKTHSFRGGEVAAMLDMRVIHIY
jgi:hypothetical protein